MDKNDPMTLSPTAQAVSNAAKSSLDWEAGYLPNAVAAAALRAVAEHVVPEYREHHPENIDEKYRKVTVFEVRNRLLAIARELEAQ